MDRSQLFDADSFRFYSKLLDVGNFIRRYPELSYDTIRIILSEWNKTYGDPSHGNVIGLLEPLYMDENLNDDLIEDLVLSITNNHILGTLTAVRRLTDQLNENLERQLDLDRFIDTVLLMPLDVDRDELSDLIHETIIMRPYSRTLATRGKFSLDTYNYFRTAEAVNLIEEIMRVIEDIYEEVYTEPVDYHDMVEQMKHRAIDLHESLTSQGLRDEIAAEIILAGLTEDDVLMDEALNDPVTLQILSEIEHYRTTL